MRISRRLMLQACGATGALAAVRGWPSWAAPLPPAPGKGGGRAVIALFLDQPYGDRNGPGALYRPPAGARGIAAFDGVDEAHWRRASYTI